MTPRDLLTTFDDLHVRYVGCRAHIRGGKDAKLVKLLAERHGDEQVVSLMRLFFEQPDDFRLSAGFTVGVFYGQFGQLLARRARQAGRVEAVQELPTPRRSNREAQVLSSLRGGDDDTRTADTAGTGDAGAGSSGRVGERDRSRLRGLPRRVS